MSFDYSGAGQTKLIPANTGDGGGGVIPTGNKTDPIFVASIAPSYVPTGFKDTLTGLPLLARVMCVDGVIEVPYPLGYINENGEYIVTTGNNVGTNTPAALKQHIGSFGGDWFASGANLTVTNADLVAAAVAAGALVRLADGTSRAALVTDFITRIDVDLKPVGGHVDVAGVQTPTTASDASHDRGGRVYDIDPGGSSSVGEMRDNNGFLVAANTADIVIKDGSGVVISFDLASIPA